MRGRLMGVIAGLAVAVTPLAARAVPSFPLIIRSELQLDDSPPCRLCHLHGTTGPGTIEMPVGVSLRARGLTGDQRSLVDALARLGADAVDSDADGVTDIDELKAGDDPNTPAHVALQTEDPRSGCSIAGAGASPSVLALLPFVVLALRRRRAGQIGDVARR